MSTDYMFGHPIPLTAYVLIALYKIETDVSGVSRFPLFILCNSCTWTCFVTVLHVRVSQY